MDKVLFVQEVTIMDFIWRSAIFVFGIIAIIAVIIDRIYYNKLFNSDFSDDSDDEDIGDNTNE